MTDLESCRKALLKAKLEDLRDGTLLRRGVDYALQPVEADSQIKTLEVIVILLRQMASCFSNADGMSALDLELLISDRIAPAFQPGGYLASLVLTNLENPLKVQQARAVDVLAAAGRLSTVLPPSTSATSSTKGSTTFLVPLFRDAITGGMTRRANLAIVTALMDFIPSNAVPTTLLPELLGDLHTVDFAHPRCTLIVELLIKFHSSALQNESSASISADQVVLPLLPFFDPDNHPQSVLTHMNRYLLPALFQKDPKYVKLLLDLLSTKAELFAAWVGVASLGVSLGLLRIEELPAQELNDALSHASGDVRLRAFELVTASKDQLNAAVLELVKKSLMWNDSLPGSGGRSSFSSATLAFFVRLHQLETLNRRNARKKAKTPSVNVDEAALTHTLATTSAFRNWFLTSYIDNTLQRALRYPVFKALLALNLLAVYLSVFGDDAGVQEEVFTRERVEMLFACQASEFTEVRARSAKILESATVPLPGYEDSSTPHAQRLLQSAVESLNHPRRTQAEAGKAALCILFRKLVQIDVDQQKSLDFISVLIAKVERSVVAIEADIVRGMEESPSHGTLSAIKDLVGQLNLAEEHAQTSWKPTFDRLFSLIERIWAVTRTVISLAPSKLDGSQSVPEHEIARAYEVLGGGDDAEEDDEGMDHTGLLSGSWRATRNAGELLAAIFAQPLAIDQDGILQTMWTSDDVDRAGLCFLTWMHEIRHRGTFSKIALAFGQLVEVVRSKAQLRGLCDGWLRHELTTIASDEISTTRRSAALPYSILAIVSSDPVLVDTAVDALIDLARVDNTSTSNITKVHAFNVLKIVLLDARQTRFFHKYFEKAVLMALRAFESPDWNVRNVGLILFSTMVHRCLSPTRGGQDLFRSRSTLATRQSFSVFHAKYPQIIPFVTKYLLDAQSTSSSGAQSGNKHSPLFPILIIIRSLRYSDAPEHRSLQNDVVDAVSLFLGSREFQVRQVAAQALSSLIPTTAAFDRVISLASPEQSKAKDLNAIHGDFLLLHLLIRNVIQWEEVTVDSRRRLDNALAQLVQTCIPGTAPPITQTLLDIVTEFVEFTQSDRSELVNLVSRRAEQYLSLGQSRPYVPAEGSRLSASVSFLLRHDPTRQRFLQLLSRVASDQEQILALFSLGENTSLLDVDLFHSVIRLALSEDVADDVRIAALEAMADLRWPEDVLTSFSGKWTAVIGRLEKSARAKCIPLKEAVLPALGWSISQQLRDDSSSVDDLTSMIESFAQLILEASDEDESRPSRWSALQSLIHLDKAVFGDRFSLQPSNSIHRSLLRLIQDDDEEIRQGAASIVAGNLDRVHGRAAVHSEMLDLYWKWIGDKVLEQETQAEWIGALVIDHNGIAQDHHILRRDRQPDSEALFGVEPPNLYRDPLVDASYAAQVLSRSASRVAQEKRDKFHSEQEKLNDLLDTVVKVEYSPIEDGWQARRNINQRLTILARR